MLYDARIPESERHQLAMLVGRHLDAVDTDQWAVQIRTGDLTLSIVPEEIATPDDEHPHADVTRPKIVTATEANHAGMQTVVSQLGDITSVAVLATVVRFSSPQRGKPTEINGVTVPEGIEYGPLFSHPLRQNSVNGNQAVVNLDIAVEIQTDRDNTIIIYTDGCGFFVHVAVNEEPVAEENLLRTEIFAA